MKKQTQTMDVIAHLIKHGSITSLEAIKKYGVTRLSAVIFNCRKRGYEIETIRLNVKNRRGSNSPIGKYKLISTPEESCVHCGTRKREGFLCPECGRI